MIHILGIRHHGVGSAQMVLQRLEEINPDLILIEGAPEIESVLHYIGHIDLTPPLAVMIYDQEDTKQSIFYPFAQFSPEWVAAKYANEHNIKIKTIDLEAKYQMYVDLRNPTLPLLPIQKSEGIDDRSSDSMQDDNSSTINVETAYRDPISYLAEIAGFDDAEQWWEYQFEINDQQSALEHFEAVMVGMRALRSEGLTGVLKVEDEIREAAMRQIIRQNQNSLYQNMVVVCGAWHAPALEEVDKYAKSDSKLLKQLPKVKNKLSASWIPWTNDRLSMNSGYGAGIKSPGWYDHLWIVKENQTLTWLSEIAVCYRNTGHDVSTAHVLESYKLIAALCQLREKSHPSLDEINQAIITVMCMGDTIKLELIQKQMITGIKIGEVPEDIPKVPLQEDFERNLKGFRIKLSAMPNLIDLDLRQEPQLNKSIFFHRLQLLKISWASPIQSNSKGTFKESWKLEWKPEMMLSLIDNAYLGNTVENAAENKTIMSCETESKISNLVKLFDNVLPARLDNSINAILNRIDNLSVISSDIQDVMLALPNLIYIQRYGDVRNSDFGILSMVIERLMNKVLVNLPSSCYGLNDEVSTQIFEQISELNTSVKLLQNTEFMEEWYHTLYKVLDKEHVHEIIKGCICRLLLDAERMDENQAHRRISFALSLSQEAKNAASWIEGFLRGSGMILIYDNKLWALFYQWLDTLTKVQFMELLPYLRRSFSRFAPKERKQIGEKAREGLNTGQNHYAEEMVHEDSIVGLFHTLDYLMGKK